MSVYEEIASLVSNLDWFSSNELYRDGLPPDEIECAAVCVMGGDTEQTHGVKNAWSHVGIRILVKSALPSAARTRADALILELNGTVNQAVSGGLVRSIFAVGPAVLLRREPNNAVIYGASFNVVRRDL